MGCGSSQPRVEFVLVPANPKPVSEMADAVEASPSKQETPEAAPATAPASSDGNRFKVAMFSSREYDRHVTL